MKTSLQIELEMQEMRRKLEELEAQYKETQKEEYEKAVKRFMDVFLKKLNLKSAEDVEKVTKILEGMEPVSEPNPAESIEELEPEKEEEKAVPGKEPEPEIHAQEEEPAKEEEPAVPAEEAAPAPQNTDFMFSNDEEEYSPEEFVYDWEGRGDTNEEPAVPTPEIKEAAPAMDLNAMTEPAKKEFDIAAIAEMPESDTRLASFKRKGAVAKCEMALLKLLDAAIKEGWLKGDEISTRIFGDANTDLKNPSFYADLRDFEENSLKSIFAGNGRAQSIEKWDEFESFPSRIKANTIAVVAADVKAYYGQE